MDQVVTLDARESDPKNPRGQRGGRSRRDGLKKRGRDKVRKVPGHLGSAVLGGIVSASSHWRPAAVIVTMLFLSRSICFH